MSEPQNGVQCVIPTHGRPDSLARALASIADQTAHASTVVVVDDLGSADSAMVAHGFEGRLDVHYIDASGEGRGGAAASRNLGARYATDCQLLAFLDDDDYWEPRFLESLVARIDEADVDLAVGWGALEYDGVLLPHCWRPEEGLTAEDVFAHNPGVTGTNFILRRSAFEKAGGFDSDQWVFNDLEFFVRFLDSGGTYSVVREDLAVQTVSRGGHLSSRSDRRADGILRYVELYTSRMTNAQRRALRRQAAMARLHTGQTAWRRVQYSLEAIALSTPADFARATRTRMSRTPRY